MKNKCLTEVTLPSLYDEPEPTEVGDLREGEGVASAAASTRVSLSESEDDLLTTLMQAIVGFAETPSWSGSAQAAPLTNTRAALTLAGAPVTNTSL